WRSLDSMTTSPPRPPSPPEGPPRGTNFSRRKAMQPLPPPPALMRMMASSMNIAISRLYRRVEDAHQYQSSTTEDTEVTEKMWNTLLFAGAEKTQPRAAALRTYLACGFSGCETY